LIVIVSLYFMVVAVFACLCTKLGELLNRFKPLTGYSLNVLGSLSGVFLFSLVSFLGWPPAVWLIIAYFLLIYFHLGRKSFGGVTGNDAAVALRNGAHRVDVVEIDPVIAELGKDLHADRPYQSQSVRLYVDDARSFLERNTSNYDLVIFATLDSHTAFSSLSSLRLDNYVFTAESLQQVAQHLNSGV